MTTIDQIPQLGAPSGEFTGLSAQRLASGDDFFRMLSAQLQAQDPLAPQDSAQFLGQLTQFSQLEQSLTTNDKLESLGNLQLTLAALQQMTQSASLIGKTVDYTDAASGDTKTGVVKAVSVDNGLVQLDVDGAKVPLPQIVSIRSADEQE